MTDEPTDGWAVTDLRESLTGTVGRYLTTEELAELARTTSATCRYWRHVGKGPRSFKLGRRVLYAESDVLAWIASVRASH